MKRKTRLGWLGPVLVLIATAVAGAGVYLMVANKPKPGDVIETVTVDATTKIVMRAEKGGDRNFVELHTGDEMAWRALVPPYAGRPGKSGIAWSEVAVSVRVVRDNKAEVFALARRDASKLGGVHLATDKGPITRDPPGPLTLTDNIRSYELVAGDGWNVMTAIDLRNGAKLWTVELGRTPITAGEVKGGLIKLQQGATARYFKVFTGKEDKSSETTGIPID